MGIDDPAGSESKRSVIGPATPAMTDSEVDVRRQMVRCLTPCDANVPTCVVES